MRLLVTRTSDDAAPLVAALEARGHDCLVEPLYRVVPADVDDAALAEALDGVQALAFTSANGARAFATRSPRRDLPVYAVGDATAAAARAAGFSQVESAGGDVEALADLVAARLDPARGALFHAAARQVAGDLQGQLTAKGFDVRRLVLYEAQPVEQLSASAEAALGAGTLDAALFFSPRSAETFVRLLKDAGLQDSGTRVHALALSAAVARALAPIAWAGTTIAARPDTTALLEAVDRLANDSTAKDQQVDDKQSDSQRPEDDDADGTKAPKSAADGAAEAPALAVIAAFGGIRPMATKLGIAVSTVQGWRERAVIPQPRHEEIMTAARDHDVSLDPALLAASDRPPVTTPAGRSALPQSGAKAEDAGEPSEEKPSAAAPTATGPRDGAREAERASRPEVGGAPKVAAAVAAAEARSARRGGAGWAFFLLGAVVFGAGAAAAVVTRPQWQPLLVSLTGEQAATPSVLEQRLAALEAKLSDVESEQVRIAQQPAPASGDGAAIENLSASLEALGTRLDALEKQVQTVQATGPGFGVSAEALTPLRDAIEQLTARVAALESQAQSAAADATSLSSLSDELTGLESRVTQAESRLASVEDNGRSLQASVDDLVETSQTARASAGGSAALALAVAQLRDALRSGAPYGAELEQLRGLSHGDPELAALLDPLAPYATSGAPTLESLQRSFAATARTAVAAAQGDEAGGWLGGVLRRVSGVITVRPVGEVEGDSAGAVIARAETRLHDGDLVAAVAELDSLQGRAADAVRGWRDQAQARVVAERALSELAAHAIAKLGPDGD